MRKTATGWATDSVVGAERTENRKLTVNPDVNRVAVTYSAQSTCPTVCPLRDNGCYAESGPLGIITRRLNRSDSDILSVATDHANVIDSLSGTVPLRLNIVGDAPTDAAARLISEACQRYTAKHGAPVWAYTHAWRDVSRESWGSVNIIASCDKPSDIDAAHKMGYTLAAMAWNGDSKPNNSFVCPQSTGAVADCISCGLCIYGRTTKTVLFPVHGARKKHAGKVLANLV